MHILLVDDDDAVRELLGDVLGSAGCTIDLADNGEQAIQRFRAGHYDAVVTDYSMPKMNGVDLIRAIRRTDSVTPIFMLTGSPSELNPTELAELGVSELFIKPISMDQARDICERLTRLKP